jgi:hypothetical protein
VAASGRCLVYLRALEVRLPVRDRKVVPGENVSLELRHDRQPRAGKGERAARDCPIRELERQLVVGAPIDLVRAVRERRRRARKLRSAEVGGQLRVQIRGARVQQPALAGGPFEIGLDALDPRGGRVLHDGHAVGA